jgi:D-glycero-alpha-D-manno-heptose 1-phosphate guanylyltransferase
VNNVIKTKKIDVVILCGGRGERLRSVLKDGPKSMIKVNGRPFLDILIDYVVSFGFKRIILCIGYKGGMIKKHYQKNDVSLTILFSEEKVALGTAGAIKNAQSLIKSNPFLVMNGDSFCQIDLNEFINFHLKKKGLFLIALSNLKRSSDYGQVVLEKSGRVVEFKEKIRTKPASNLVNAGIYLLDKAIFSEIPENKKYSLEYEVFPKIVNRRFYGFVVQEKFIDIGIPARFQQARLSGKFG